MCKLYLSASFLLFGITAHCQKNVPTGASLPSATIQHISYPLSINTVISPTYNRSFVPVIPITDTALINMSADVKDVHITTTYMDELGRPVQSVIRQASPNKKDFVNINTFDELGRNSLNILPYTAISDNDADGLIKTSALSADSVFYHNNFPDELVYFARTNYDGSPLNLIKKTMAPGNSWSGSSIGTSVIYRTNAANDSVRLWTIDINTDDDVPTTNTIYAAGTLGVIETINEDGKKTITFIDELGRKILVKTQLASSPTTGHTGWLCAYMIYDEMNKLRFFVSPKATELLNTTYNWNLNTNSAVISDLCYSYFYDNFGRVTTKHLPNKAKTYLIYDALGHIVLTQDSVLRNTDQWQFIKYDGQNRTSKTGLITLSGQSRSTITAAADTTANYPALSGTYTVMSEVYYDDYSWVSGSGSGLSSSLVTTDITSTYFAVSGFNTSPTYAQEIVATANTRGAITGTKTLVLNTSTNLYSINFFDDHFRSIQTAATNITGGTDIATMQYDFSGKVIKTLVNQQKSGTNAHTHKLETFYTYDHMGRPVTIRKKIDAQTNTLIGTYAYNELGQLKTKTLGSSLEQQDLTYNIRGWLNGINKSYAEGSGTRWFGEEIFYDFGFTQNQLTGRVAGQRWRSQGDGKYRAYGYDYDASGQLKKADFTQNDDNSSGNWNNNAGIDFSVSNLTYDANGNIQTMTQRGLKINASDVIDSLTYGYNGIGNQLRYVTDAKNDTTSRLGDFKEITNDTTADYTYDGNGSLISDSNKRISSIKYNFMNLPDTITITGKGTIVYTYDAKGTRLRKTVTEGAIVTATTYIAGFVYRNDTLQLIGHEEGRIRPAFDTAALSNLTYDYFVKDHQGNTRLVLTAESRTDNYPAATMETAQATTEEALYANVNTTRTTKPLSYPTDTTTNPNNYVAKLMAASGSQSIGPAITLKVMAGDKFNVKVSSWYKTNGTTINSPANILTDLLNSLTGGISGVSSGTHGITQGQLESGNILNSGAAFFLGSEGGSEEDVKLTKPNAYLNWILFDEQFNIVGASSGFEQVGTDNHLTKHIKSNMPITANGYLYVYVSNATPNIPVYFDNLQVTHIRGPLLQEDHYYPHGLEMAGISSSAFSTAPTNIYKANASSQIGRKEWADGSGLELYETPGRNYDAQIGRFHQTDPLMEQIALVSEYAFVGNNPVTGVDPTGLIEGDNAWWAKFDEQGGGISRMEADRKKDMDGGGGSFVDWSSNYSPTSSDYYSYLLSHFSETKAGTYWFQNGQGQYSSNTELIILFGNIRNGRWITSREDFSLNLPFYETPEAAAKGWGKLFNSASILSNREYGGAIFSYPIKGKTYYSFNVPNIGGAGSVQYQTRIPNGATMLGWIHSHANYASASDDDFSIRGRSIYNQPHYDSDQYHKYETELGAGKYFMFLTTPGQYLQMWAPGYSEPPQVQLYNYNSGSPLVVTPSFSPGKSDAERQNTYPVFSVPVNISGNLGTPIKL